MENFKHVFKLLWAKLIIGLVAAALCCAFVLPELLEIWKSEEVRGLIKNLKEALKVLFSADPEAMEEIKEKLVGEDGSFRQVVRLLVSMRLEIILTCIGCAVVYLLKRFAETVCHFTTGSMLNDKMAAYAETSYSTAFVANLGKASVYSLVYVPVVFIFDIITLAVAYLVLSLTSIVVGMFCAFTILACGQALKLTFTSSWLPAMTADDKKLSEAIRNKDKNEKKQRTKVFATYLVSVYFIIIVNVMAAICTFGSALIISVPASYFFLICLQYVNYYTLKGKRYFLTYEYIASNPDCGDSEHFFSYISEEEKSNVEEKQENK